MDIMNEKEHYSNLMRARREMYSKLSILSSLAKGSDEDKYDSAANDYITAALECGRYMKFKRIGKKIIIPSKPSRKHIKL